MEKLKKCSKCGRELPVSEFWKNALRKMCVTIFKHALE